MVSGRRPRDVSGACPGVCEDSESQAIATAIDSDSNRSLCYLQCHERFFAGRRQGDILLQSPQVSKTSNNLPTLNSHTTSCNLPPRAPPTVSRAATTSMYVRPDLS